MSISVGEKIPENTLKKVTKEGPADVKTSELFAGKKVILFGLPGAFTPTCHNKHVPGFIENAESFAAKGIDEIAVLSVNDPFVMTAWQKATENGENITFLSDGNAEFSKALGLDIDLSIAGFGVRCKRFSMLVEDGIVRSLNIEENPGQAETSGAQNMLNQLG